jgi:hypothetical protein
VAGCPASGPIPVATTGVGTVYWLAQDGVFLYWTSVGRLLKVVKN